MDLMKVIHERQSIRKYKEDEVPEEILLEIIDAARRSPSWANSQTWRFVIVKDKSVKEALAKTLTENNPAKEAVTKAPILVCLVSEKGVSGFRKGVPRTSKGDYYMFDAGIAMEHIVLAAWNFGLGTCHIGAFNHEEAEKILGVPEGYTIVAMSPIGYFDEKPNVTPRKPLKEILFLNRFGNPYINEP
ncbi:MAG: nitroreductase family protein [Desulfobacterota bacterium]|nr:nitroreductase family protein [Thermodesulfobacteriota bacterium]